MLENGHVWRKYIYHRYREFLFRGSFNTISHLDAGKFLMPLSLSKMIQSHPGKKEKSRCRLTTLKHFSVGKLQLPSWKTLATHALNIHKHTSSLVSTWPIETYISVVNQHQATYETQSYLTQFTA